MSQSSIEERVSIMERELAQIKRSLQSDSTNQAIPWWEKIAGTFANSENYDEAMRLGREYRESLRLIDEEGKA